ncbi:hypothetical protein ABEB36_003800, partial [Hypothenemus hampei]
PRTTQITQGPRRNIPITMVDLFNVIMTDDFCPSKRIRNNSAFVHNSRIINESIIYGQIKEGLLQFEINGLMPDSFNNYTIMSDS